MKSAELKLEEKLLAKEKIALEKQIVEEVKLLKEFDPDIELNAEFEKASLIDLQKYLDA